MHVRNFTKANPDKKVAMDKNYYARNGEAIRKRAVVQGREWRQANPERRRARVAAYKAAKARRTPPWVDLLAMEKFYVACPKDHEVDHIIPLRGKLVSGLHVLSNLQYLTTKANRSKGNSYDPNY